MFDIRSTDHFIQWFKNLRDRHAQQRITVRIERIAEGLLGDVKPVGGGVSEARIHYGPGYRLYFTQREGKIVILLCGGDKSTQARDIARAIKLAEDEP